MTGELEEHDDVLTVEHGKTVTACPMSWDMGQHPPSKARGGAPSWREQAVRICELRSGGSIVPWTYRETVWQPRLSSPGIGGRRRPSEQRARRGAGPLAVAGLGGSALLFAR